MLCEEWHQTSSISLEENSTQQKQNMDFDKKKPQSSIGHDVITGFCPVNLVQNGYQKFFKMAQPT